MYVACCSEILSQTDSYTIPSTESILPASIWYCKTSALIPRDWAALYTVIKLSFFSLVSDILHLPILL